jgi:exportin-5
VSTGGTAGLWYHAAAGEPPHIGVFIVLEVLRLVAEDCTDSDFNAKISTQRRNDVLMGLNDIHGQFLPFIYQHLQQSYPLLQQTQQTIHNMHVYLIQSQRTRAQMTQEEASAYRVQVETMQETAQGLVDTLITLEQFSSSMPTNWMIPDDSTTSADGNNHANLDFVAALMHLMRESSQKLQIRAVEAMEQLIVRGKLSELQWLRLIRELPVAVQEANNEFHGPAAQQRQAERMVSGPSEASVSEDPLALQVDFHRALSKMLSAVITSHLSNITNNKHVVEKQSGPDFENIQAYLRLLVEMLKHPSGRICSEQVNVWISLLRDPQIARTALLEPLLRDVMTCYMQHGAKLRWQDIEEHTHPMAGVLEASFDDEDDLAAWNADLRARTSVLFRAIGHSQPHIAAQVLNERVKLVLQQHGSGEPMNHLDTSNSQLTEMSDAVMQFEGLAHPLDNTMSGFPAWSMQNDAQSDPSRAERRTMVQAALTEMATSLVSWNPSYIWLKFRRTSLINPLMYFWRHDPTTLLPAVDSLLRNLGLSDEWNRSAHPGDNMSDQMVGLKKRSGVALVSISKKVPQHLVPWLSQLSQATGALLSSQGLIPMNQMHLYEFLSCVANAVDDPHARSNFIADVLSGAVETVLSSETTQLIASPHTLLTGLGVTQAADQPGYVTERANVEMAANTYHKIFSAFNRLLSVGRRCNEAARSRPNPESTSLTSASQPMHPIDEGPVSIHQLAIKDPFVVLWPRILPALLQVYETVLSVWRPEHQAILLQNSMQRYVYAISDDEAFLAKNVDAKSGGVFGEGGTAGSVVSGTDRRDINLVPKWSGWLNELRNTCFQLMGLLIAQGVLFAPEIADMYPRIVAVLTDSLNLQSMEHRHFTQFLKHVVEILLTSCPSALYPTHLAPIVGPIFEHVRSRLEKTWQHFGDPSSNDTKALTSANALQAANLAASGGDAWFSWYYSHAGLFVGDLDAVTAEGAVEKYRFEISRSLADMLQVALALKGEWALVLANVAKEEQARRKNDDSRLSTGPSTRFTDDGINVNADGTPRMADQDVLDAKRLLRINGLAHFLLLENEHIAGNLCLLVIQCLGYPDAYTCRRITKICHRVIETTSWTPQYSQLLGQSMFQQAVKNIVTEPKWMVGMEWAMINVARDIYCRLILGQVLQPGGQGAAAQQQALQENAYPPCFEQSKTYDRPLLGGGILTVPSEYPRQTLVSLPGITAAAVQQLETSMKEKRSAKDHKDLLRDLLREASLHWKAQHGSNTSNMAAAATSLFDTAVEGESLLHRRDIVIPDLPEKHVTLGQARKAAERRQRNLSCTAEGLQAFGI